MSRDTRETRWVFGSHHVRGGIWRTDPLGRNWILRKSNVFTRYRSRTGPQVRLPQEAVYHSQYAGTFSFVKKHSRVWEPLPRKLLGFCLLFSKFINNWIKLNCTYNASKSQKVKLVLGRRVHRKEPLWNDLGFFIRMSRFFSCVSNYDESKNKILYAIDPINTTDRV